MEGKEKKDGKQSASKMEALENKKLIERLQLEKDSLQSRVRELISAHEKEVQVHRSRYAELLEQKDRGSTEQKLLHSISAALVSLYIELKERKALTVSEDMEAEHRALNKANPMVILAYIRTHIRSLLSSYEDSELELRAQLKLAYEEAQRNVRDLKEKVQAAQDGQTRALGIAEEAKDKLEDAELAKDSALSDTKNLIDQVKSDQMALVLQMRAKGEENEKLQRVIEEKDRLLKQQEAQVLRVSGLESEIQTLKAENLLSRKKLEAQHNAKTSHFKNEIKKLAMIESENEALQGKLKMLELELKNARTAYTSTSFQTEQMKAQRFEKLHQTKSKQVEDLETKIRSLQKTAEKNEKDAAEWREKYKKLYEAVRKQGMEREERLKNNVDVHHIAEQLSVPYYKDLVREKDREIQQLTTRIKRLSSSNLNSKLSERNFLNEKMQMSEKINELHHKLQLAEDANSELLQLVSRQEATVVSHRRASSPTEPPAQRRSSIAGSVISPPSSPARGRGFAYKMGSSMGSLVLQEEEMSIAEMEQEDQSPPRPSRNPLRPFSAMSRRSARMDAIPDDLQERREEEDDGLWLRSREETMDEATVSRIAELEEANRRMTVELKQMKNVMAISRGAADAYEAVVARLGATENGARSDEDEDEEVGELPERVKPGKSRKSQVTKMRELASFHRPPRPQSAPPGRDPLISRPSSALRKDATTTTNKLARTRVPRPSSAIPGNA
uniref:Uncharacterized protein n=1 Tax=Hanusia phi TaxID=3032 RepID=A0A7S0HN84_9CRYP|mmetsp:Transcript_29832/g.67481  ORF Transcript_29832/g.67481 Transcript_29832/m.67481 type:complete len:730 (+) Transcript_29832:200-2389(+)